MSVSHSIVSKPDAASTTKVTEKFRYDGEVDNSGVHWVRFGANSYLERAAGLGFGVGNAENFVLSCWLNPDGDNGISRGIISMNNVDEITSWFGVTRGSSHAVTANASDTVSGDTMNQDPANSIAIDSSSGPTHIYVTADKNRATASERIQLFINGVKVAESDWDDSSNTFDLNGLPFWVGRVSSGSYNQSAWKMDIGAIWFIGALSQVNFDLLSVSDFYVDGKAQDLGANGKTPSGGVFGPYIYFDVRPGETVSDFSTNKSLFGGAFALAGTITD